MTTISEFILARVAEDERRARIYGRKGMTTRLRDLAERNAQRYGGPHPPELDVSPPDALWWNARDVADYADQFDPARVLRQCDAIRAIVALNARLLERSEPRSAVIETLRIIASIWSEHADFQEAWTA